MSDGVTVLRCYVPDESEGGAAVVLHVIYPSEVFGGFGYVNFDLMRGPGVGVNNHGGYCARDAWKAGL